MKNCNFQQCSNLILNNLIDEKYIHISKNHIEKSWLIFNSQAMMFSNRKTY